ncbi:MAG: hypothetical protein KAS88_05405 [Deltaproteobacteria bacterium]|nr:hypothetical protein [Deltaproteobacteria bacterium]
METSKTWDVEALNTGFFAKSRNAERYLDEVKTKVVSNQNYEMIFDEHYAIFHVYTYLCDKAFLESRMKFIAELKSLLGHPIDKPTEVYDFGRFKQFRKNIIENLIKKFEKA